MTSNVEAVDPRALGWKECLTFLVGYESNNRHFRLFYEIFAGEAQVNH